MEIVRHIEFESVVFFVLVGKGKRGCASPNVLMKPRGRRQLLITDLEVYRLRLHIAIYIQWFQGVVYHGDRWISHSHQKNEQESTLVHP